MLKDKPFGIKLITLLLITPIIFYWFFVLLQSSYCKIISNLPEPNKTELALSGKLKCFNVNSMEDLENYLASLNQTSRDLPNPGFIWSLVPIILALGILTLARWARWGVILWAGFFVSTGIAWFTTGGKVSALLLIWKILSIPINLFFIVYLIRPKVKKLFKLPIVKESK